MSHTEELKDITQRLADESYNLHNNIENVQNDEVEKYLDLILHQMKLARETFRDLYVNFTGEPPNEY